MTLPFVKEDNGFPDSTHFRLEFSLVQQLFVVIPLDYLKFDQDTQELFERYQFWH